MLIQNKLCKQIIMIKAKKSNKGYEKMIYC